MRGLRSGIQNDRSSRPATARSKSGWQRSRQHGRRRPQSCASSSQPQTPLLALRVCIRQAAIGLRFSFKYALHMTELLVELHFGTSDTGIFPGEYVSSTVQDDSAKLEAERQQRLEAEQAAAEAAAALEEAQQQVTEEALATRRSMPLQYAAAAAARICVTSV